MSQILAINAGSSSLKFALFQKGNPPKRLLFQHVDLNRDAGDLIQKIPFDSVEAVGHRIVNGGPNATRNTLITPDVLAGLKQMSPFDPDHLPLEIELIEVIQKRFPNLAQVACFDTVFHHQMPPVAKLIPIPRKFYALGVRRYGFHGLSYAYLMEELERTAPPASLRRVILCHLGNGASLAAVRDGKCIDTSMGFSPASGLPMSTRSGDLDPELSRFLKMNAEEFHEMVHRQSGLLGVSETSGDMRALLAAEASDYRAAEAIELFCYQVKKWIGAFAAALGGVDTLVFSGGIGENSPVIRKRICEGLGFLGSELSIKVMKTDEEVMIAKETQTCIKT